MVPEVVHNLDVVRGTEIQIYDLFMTFRANGHPICNSGWKDLERNPPTVTDGHLCQNMGENLIINPTNNEKDKIRGEINFQ